MSTLSMPSLTEEFAALLAAEPCAITDPYRLNERLRREAPVFRFQPGTVILSRHRHIKEAFRDAVRLPSPSERLVRYEERFARLSAEELGLYADIARFESLFISRRTVPITGATGPRFIAASPRAGLPSCGTGL